MVGNVGIPAVPSGLDRGLSIFLQAMAENVRILAGTARGSNASRAVREYERGGTSSAGGASSIIGTASLEPQSVTASKIADGAVVEKKIALGAVTESRLAVSAVTGRTIRPGAVESVSLAEGAVTGTKIATKAVTAGKIADGAVEENHMARGAVSTLALAEGAVTASKIANGVLPKVPPQAVFVEGMALDGEEVLIPGTYAAKPLVCISTVHAVAKQPDVVEPPVEEGEVGVGTKEPEPSILVGLVALTELTNENGAGTGVWKFTAAGTFAWVAMGYENV